MEFAAPAPSTGDVLSPGEVLGHLLVIAPIEYRTGIMTRFTRPGDPPSEAIAVNVAVLTQQDAAGQYGVIYKDVLWFNVKLRNSLRRSIGKLVLARMGQGQATPGNDAPYELIDATKDAQAVQFATAWLQQHPEFEQEALAEIAALNKVSAPAPAAPAVPTPAPSPAVVPAASPTPLPQTPQVAPATPAAPATPTPTPGTATQSAAVTADVLAALPPEEQAKLRALLGQQ